MLKFQGRGDSSIPHVKFETGAEEKQKRKRDG